LTDAAALYRDDRGGGSVDGSGSDGVIRSLEEASTSASRDAGINKRKRPQTRSTYGAWGNRRKKAVQLIDSGRGQLTGANSGGVVVDAALFDEVKVDQPGDCVYVASSKGLLIARGTQVAVCNMRRQVSEELVHHERKLLYGWSSDQQHNYRLMADQMREMGVWSIDLNKQVLPALANVFTVTFVVWERVSSDPGKLSILRSFSPVGQLSVKASEVILGVGPRTVIHLLGSPQHYDLLILKAQDPLIHGPRIETCVPAGRRSGDSVQSNKAQENGNVEMRYHGGEGGGGGEVQQSEPCNVLLQHLNMASMQSVADLAKATPDPHSRAQHLQTGLARIEATGEFLQQKTLWFEQPTSALEDVDRIEGGIDRDALLASRIAVSPCCESRCIPNTISLNAHLAALKTKNDLPRQLFVEARLLDLSGFSRGDSWRGRLAYTFMFEGTVICQLAYSLLHGICPRTFRRYIVQADDGQVMPRRLALSRVNNVDGLTVADKRRRDYSWREHLINAWLTRILPRLTEFNPTKCQISIQLETYATLYDRYARHCDQLRLAGNDRGKKSDMTRVLTRHPWDEIMTTRFNPDVCVCTICQVYTTAMSKIDSRKNRTEYKELIAKKEAHRAEWEGRRNLAADLAMRGAEMKELAVVQTDGADSSKTMCPTLACHTKMEDVRALTVKLQGVSLQGVGLWLFAIPEYLKSGANMLCTCLLLACQKAAVVLRDRGQSMPRKLVVEVDGGSENWNSTTLRFFCLLVNAGVYDVMELIRCPPGHGHNRLDGMYGFLSQWLHGVTRGKNKRAGHDVYTLGQFKAAAMESLKGSELIDMEDVEFAWDFNKFLGEHILPDMKGHGANQRADFTFGQNVTWWKIHAHKGPGPTQTRGVYLLHKLGFLDNAVDSGWLPKQNGNKGYLVTGFDKLPATPGYHDFDAAKLTEFKETKRDEIINQFITPVGSDPVDMLSTHGKSSPGSIKEWRTYFDALPASADADAHVQTLSKKEANAVPGYFLPSFERTADSLTESSECLAIDVGLSLQDDMQGELLLDPVTHDAAERHALHLKHVENSDKLTKDKEVTDMQLSALTDQDLNGLEIGDLVVLAVVGQVLPFMVASVLGKQKRGADLQIKIRWYSVKNVKVAPKDKETLESSIACAIFHEHDQSDWVPWTSVMLCHPLLTTGGKFSKAPKRKEGQDGGKAMSTFSEMIHLTHLGVLCK
jgi:hypothetical protein